MAQDRLLLGVRIIDDGSVYCWRRVNLLAPGPR